MNKFFSILLTGCLLFLSIDPLSAQITRRGRRPARPTRPFRRPRRPRPRPDPPGRTLTATSEELGRVVCSTNVRVAPQNAPTADGTCNNLQNRRTILTGATGEIHPRLTPANFSDGRSQIVTGRPNPRNITNTVVAQSRSNPSANGGSQLVPFFGQFIDHDLDLAGMSRTSRLDIPISDPDDIERFGGDLQFFRSEPVNERSRRTREFRNDITTYLDLSSVYGSDRERAEALREGRGGLLKTRNVNGDELLDLNTNVNIEMDQNNENTLAAGDPRANEHAVLISLTTLFAREHNRLAREFQAANTRASDEEIYQAARIRNIAQYQSIVYGQFLPSVLGDNVVNRIIGRDRGFNRRVNPEISLEFSTACFRWGHSAVPDNINFVNTQGTTIRRTPVSDLFFRPEILEQTRGLVDAALIGITRNAHEEIDIQVVDSLRQALFNNLDIGPFDLIALNIQRGRDHGIGTINALRRRIGLRPFSCQNDPADCFRQLTGENQVSAQLAQLYGDIDSCDLWICGLAEEDTRGSQLGETFSTVLAQQFRNLRDGDRFFFERNRDLVRELSLPIKMSAIYERNIPGFRTNSNNLFLV